MVESQIADRIRHGWSSFTKSDRMVARRLLSDYPIAGLKTLAELAARAGVSGPSVIRCVKKLGFDGYPEFQRALHDEIQAGFEGFSTGGNAGDGNPEFSETELAYSQSIRKTIRLMLQSDVDALAALVARSRGNVLCLGGRVSHALAMIVHANLLRLRRNVELVSTNPVERAERLMDIGKGDVVILFDFKPYDANAVSFAALAADARAVIACFTDFEQSPASERAQYVFCADNRITNAVPSLAAALCAAEILLNKVRSLSGSRARSRSRSLTGVDAPLVPGAAES